MALVSISPAFFIDVITKIGIPTLGGAIPLTSYVSAAVSMGGADTAKELVGQLRYMKDQSGLYGGTVPTKHTRTYDLIWKGQGYPSDFGMLWNWMYVNLDQIRKLRVQTYSMKPPPEGGKPIKTPGKLLQLKEVFRVGRSFPEGMKELIDNKCFGWDCIGFVGQYLVSIGHLKAYPNWECQQYISSGGFKKVDLAEIAPLCVLVFGNYHIVIVDSVHSLSTDASTGMTTAKVTVCQSYTGGPHKRVATLRQGPDGTVKQVGVIDAAKDPVIGKHPDLSAAYPSSVLPTELGAVRSVRMLANRRFA